MIPEEIDINKFEDEWKRQYEKMESDIELHRISFILTKKCDCKSGDCRHYQKEKKFLFERRMNELLGKGIKISALADVHFMALNSNV